MTSKTAIDFMSNAHLREITPTAVHTHERRLSGRESKGIAGSANNLFAP